MDKEKIIINDRMEGDPLSEENLDKTLNFLHEFRLSLPEKTIWLYSGYTWEQIMKYEYGNSYINNFNVDALRQAIVTQCNVLIDGRYINSQRNISAKWKGSYNQRVIDIQKSLQQGKVILYCD